MGVMSPSRWPRSPFRNALRGCRIGRRSQFRNEPQDVVEEGFEHQDERKTLASSQALADNISADLKHLQNRYSQTLLPNRYPPDDAFAPNPRGRCVLITTSSGTSDMPP